MGRLSTAENKGPYQLRREELGLSREQASELANGVTVDRIVKIEQGKSLPHPEEIYELSKAYKKPDLCNYYCSKECRIGKEYVPEIKIKDLSQIVLEMLASLNSISKKQERLIEITADGIIDKEEIKDFVKMQKELEQISITVETLQLWSEQMLANNSIDIDLYNKYKNEL